MQLATFKRASKRQARLRMALIGPSGAGKTYTGLTIACHLIPGGRVAVIDTERGSASLYADQFEFDVAELQSFHPQAYIDAILAAEEADYDVLLIDSLSHAWMGKDGALELVDRAAKRYQGNSFAAWRDVTPLHNQLVDTILQAKLHIIATFRAKTEWVLEPDPRTGKTQPRKVGLAPQFRDGIEYEFGLVADLDHEHTLIVSKSRFATLADAVIQKPGPDLAERIRALLLEGEPEPELAPEPARNGTADRREGPVPAGNGAPDGLAALVALAAEKGVDESGLAILAFRAFGVHSLGELNPRQVAGLAKRVRECEPEYLRQVIEDNRAHYEAAAEAWADLTGVEASE